MRDAYAMRLHTKVERTTAKQINYAQHEMTMCGGVTPDNGNYCANSNKKKLRGQWGKLGDGMRQAERR